VKVLVSEQVLLRLRTLHPERKKEIRQALSDLERDRGDRKELTDALAGFYRLRVGRYRIVYCYREKCIEAVFLELRSVVYELFRP
jgi:mRNA interferase RelE/StbE